MTIPSLLYKIETVTGSHGKAQKCIHLYGFMFNDLKMIPGRYTAILERIVVCLFLLEGGAYEYID